MRLSPQLCVIEQLYYPGRSLIYVLIITPHNLIEFICRHFDAFKPTLIWVYHCHAGETNITLNDRAAWMLFYYRLAICSYQVHTNHISQFQFCVVFGLQTSINILSFLNCWHILHGLAYISTCVKRPFQQHVFQKKQQFYYYQGGIDRNGTNIAHVCIDFVVLIFFYHSRLSQLCQEFAWSKRISNQKCMLLVWNIFFSAPFVVLVAHLRCLVRNNIRSFLPY